MNDRYVGRFSCPSDLKPDSCYYFWTEQYQEPSAKARFMQYADLEVFDRTDCHHYFGRLFLSNDTDLNPNGYRSLTLYLRDSEIYLRDPQPKIRIISKPDSEPIEEEIKPQTKEWKSMHSIVKYELRDDDFVELPEFLKLIKRKPCCKIENLVDDLDEGLVLVEFRRHNNCSASIEYSVNPDKQNLYFEIVDWNDYEDGTFVDFNSDRRHHVIKYEKLDNSTKQNLADRINLALDELYKNKLEGLRPDTKGTRKEN